VPHVVAAQPKPLTLQVTAVFVTWPGAMMVTVVEPVMDGFAREIAVMTTVAGFGAVAGAV
jgi:hypothetical protein